MWLSPLWGKYRVPSSLSGKTERVINWVPLKRMPGHFSLDWNETSTWSIQVIDYSLAWDFMWRFMEEPRLGVNWTCEMHYIPLCIPYLPPQVKSKAKERWSLRSFRILSMIYFSFFVSSGSFCLTDVLVYDDKSDLKATICFTEM